MKLIKFDSKKIILIIFILNSLIEHGLLIKLKEKNKMFPFADSQYRQANVPPIIAVIFDVPAYGKSELFKWNDFIKANEMAIQRNRKSQQEIIDDSFNDRLKRIGLIKAKLDSQDYKKKQKK